MAFPLTNINIILFLHYITITNNVVIIYNVPCTMTVYNNISQTLHVSHKLPSAVNIL